MRTLTALVLSFAAAGRATTVLSTYDSSHVHQLSPKPVTINLAGGIGTGEVKATATTKTDGSESLHAIFDKKEGEIPRYRMPPPLGDNKWKPWAGNNIAAPAERGSEAGEYAYGRGSQYLYVEETNGKKKYTVELVAIVDQDGRVWQNDGSTEECEMSRSCHRAMFSSAA